MTRNNGDVTAIADRMERREARVQAACAREEKAMAAARPRAIGRARGDYVEVEIFEGGRRMTWVDRRTKAAAIWGISSLDPHQLYAGVVYGAVVEKILGAGQSPLLQMRVDSCGVAPDPYEEKFRLIARRDAADSVIGDGFALEPKYHTARKPEGSAALGRRHGARTVAGATVWRRPISDRYLVSAICVAGLPVTAVLSGWGWPQSGRYRTALAEALGLSLTRIYDEWQRLGFSMVEAPENSVDEMGHDS